MTNAQLYTIIALCIYAMAMVLIGCISYGKSKTLDKFLIGGRNIGAWVTAFAYGTTYFQQLFSLVMRGSMVGTSASQASGLVQVTQFQGVFSPGFYLLTEHVK